MNSAAIEDEAVRWFVRRESGRWTSEEDAQLHAWLEVSDLHRIAYIRVEAGWKQAARMKALGAGVLAGTLPPRGAWGDRLFFKGLKPRAHPSPQSTGEHSINARKRPGRWWIGAAASLGIVVTAAVLAVNGGLLQGKRYSTSVGGFENVALEDGSRVLLNTNSRIHVDMQATARLVALTQGEAFFDVAPDPARPFVVEAGNKRIVVVGTKFSVRREGDEVQVVVTEGKVRLDTVLLAAGSVARTAKKEVLIDERAAVAAEKMLSWRTGFINFDNQTLEEVVTEFNRYNTRQIVIEEDAIRALPLSGNFRANNTEAFLWLLQSKFPVAVEEGAARVVLRAR